MKPKTKSSHPARESLLIANARIVKWQAENSNLTLQREENRFGSSTKILDLSNLSLSHVPSLLQTLEAVENIDLSGNGLVRLPSWISKLRNLKGLNLSRNRLRSIPPELSTLKDLRVLWLGANSLKNLPVGMLSLKYLFELEVQGNPELRLPASISNSNDAREILRYYFESQGQKGQPLLELKLLVVGRGKAGKTTLVKRLASEQPDENESETHSISIRDLSINCPKGKVRTRAWDFGGQEILHSTHQFFLTERSLYMLVLEPRTGLAQRDAEYWLKLIETQSDGSPTIVVMNWSGVRKWKVDEVKLKRKFPFIVGFISTDALSGEGISKLRETIVETVEDQMGDVWLPFPRRWREIKDAVASMKENFLTYRQYVGICENFGEADPSAQSDLAGILHTLGLALYFGNDPRLHDTRVLNPGWVTGGVYSVIRSNSVGENDGQLSVSDMSFVLQEAEEQNVIKACDYPLETHRFILELMRAFQLCYANEDRRQTPCRSDCTQNFDSEVQMENSENILYLVPELLPEFEPEMEQLWEKAPVRLRYKYEVLPPGLLPRFIVRTHALSDGSPHWRHGVVLRHADSLALIRAETDRPELQVFSEGGVEETRQVLIAIVRRELESLHVEFKMQPTEELELTGESDQWIGVKALCEIEEPGRPTQKLPVQPQGTAEVNVVQELNKLLPAKSRAIDRDPSSMPTPVKVFVSYAHDDERRLKRLDSILDVLEQQHGLTSWRDQRLIAGEEWDTQIRDRLEEMDIFLFVASQTSLVRPYIKDPELKRAKERHRAGEIEIVAIKLEPCACDEDEFLGKLQRLAPKYKSIAEVPLKSSAWEQVRKDLLPVIEKVRVKKTKAAT